MPLGQVVSQQGLANLATYKYSGNDQSILSKEIFFFIFK